MTPESWHKVAIAALKMAGDSPYLRGVMRKVFRVPSDPVKVFGLQFPNRVGLAAGFDKDVVAWRGLSCLGFGFLEVGTLTLHPQEGNPKPRIWKDGTSITNSMGCPNPGIIAAIPRLRDARQVLRGKTILGVNIGKGADTPLREAVSEYSTMVRLLCPYTDYLTLNLSSPNTRSLRLLQFSDALHSLLEKVMLTRDVFTLTEGRHVPVLVKVSPDLVGEDLLESVGIMQGYGVDGVIATNTMPHPLRVGGLSGHPLAESSAKSLKTIHERYPNFPLVASGGIVTPKEARSRLEMGARLVQVYSGMVLSGPFFPSRVVKECSRVA